MNTTLARLAAMVLAAATPAVPALAAPPARAAKPGKTVTLYQAAGGYLYFTPAQARLYHYAYPDRTDKMTKVLVSPNPAKAELAKTRAALMAGNKSF